MIERAQGELGELMLSSRQHSWLHITNRHHTQWALCKVHGLGRSQGAQRSVRPLNIAAAVVASDVWTVHTCQPQVVYARSTLPQLQKEE